jgi:hypothetical protein
MVVKTCPNAESEASCSLYRIILEIPLSSINNPEVKQLVAKMVVADLSAKSINNYVRVVKMVVASALNENGEELYPRKWNHEFLDLPEVKNQKRPAFTSEVINGIIHR